LPTLALEPPSDDVSKVEVAKKPYTKLQLEAVLIVL
jgi:hypothetical protein